MRRPLAIAWRAAGTLQLALLAAAPLDCEAQYSPGPPYAELRPGLFGHVLVSAGVRADLGIEVLDLLVTGAQDAVALTFDGPAIVHVRLGQATLRQHGESHPLEAGAAFQVEQGDRGVAVENRSAAPLVLRAYVVLAR